MFHKSARGRVINFDEMVHKNATTVAVGNANLNARGDLLGPSGAIVETAEQRRMQNQGVVTTTSKVSIQSEISSLKAARNQWVGSEVVQEEIEQPVAEEAVIEAPVVEQVAVEEPAPAPEASVKKARKITESE